MGKPVKPLEEAFDELLDRDTKPTIEECAKLIQQYAPKNFKGWSALLRQVADYIDAQPETVWLTSKQVGALMSLIGTGLLPESKE